MGQSRRMQHMVYGLSRKVRLIARARSYRVQMCIAGEAWRGRMYVNVQNTWHDIQIIPRTHQREDISTEWRVTVQ